MTTTTLLQAFKQAASVSGRAKQMCRFFQGLVVGPRHQHRVTATRRDLHWRAVIVDLLDEQNQVLARFTRCYRHS